MNKKKKKLPKNGSIPTVSSPRYSIRDIDKKTLYYALGGFLMLAMILYFQCLSYGYVLDDKIALSENNFVKKGFAGIWEIFTTDTFRGYLGEATQLLPGGRYRPLSLITFAIEYQIFGLSPKISHFINIILYGLCGFFAWICLRRLFLEKVYSKKVYLSFSFLVAVLFLLHPIHTEAVANIKGRDEIMAFLFSILALFYALKYVDTQKMTSIVLMAIIYMLGLLSKENTITFLAIIPFALWLFRPDYRKSIIAIFGVLLLTTIAYLAIRFSIIDFSTAESTDVMNNPFVGMNSGQRYSTIIYTLLKYIQLSFFPHPLTHDYYPYHIPIMSFGDWRVILSLIVHVIMIGLIFTSWKKHKKISFAIFFYFASISIVSNVVVGVGTFMNERFAFMASLGICIIIVYLLQKLSKKISQSEHKKYLIGSIVIIGILFSIKTITRVPAWESELALNLQGIKTSKNSARANSFMATALFNKHKEVTDPSDKQKLILEAEPYALKAVQILPYYQNANIMLSGIAAEKYKYDKNLPQFLASFKGIISRRPDIEYLTTYLKYLMEREDYSQLQKFFVEISNTLSQQNKKDWALHYLNIINTYNPQDPIIKKQIYDILMSQGKTSQAQNYK